MLDAEQKLAQRLVTDHDRNALSALLTIVPNRLAWCAELAASLEGLHGPVLTPAQLGESLRDYVANGNQNPNLPHFRKYMQRTARTAPTPTSGNASLILSKIRLMIQESQQPGQGRRRYIVRGDVAKLGADILAAYDAIGGSDRMIAATGENMSFLLRDFTQALDAARAA